MIELLLKEFHQLTFETFFLAVVHSSPFWGIVVFLFKHYFKQNARAQQHAADRLSNIETTLQDIRVKMAEINPTEQRRSFDDLREVQKVQGIEIQSLWEMLTRVNRRRDADLSVE